MKIRKCSLTITLFSTFTLHPGVSAGAKAQTVDSQGTLLVESLRSLQNHKKLPTARASDGTLFILLDEQDGIRIQKRDVAGSTVLAEFHDGSKGDSASALSIDPAGNLYVVGTSISQSLSGTTGTVFPSSIGSASNSFLAKYDHNLHLIFLTFLGADNTAATGVATTADAVFVTGTTLNATFPTTSFGVRRTPSPGSRWNGFVERFSKNGSALVYSTYLTGAYGDTLPAAIVADNSDSAYIAGSTSASSYPTIAALQPAMGISPGLSASGFLTRLSPTGTAFVFSTYIAGSGITGLVLDASMSSLLLAGNILYDQFPVAATKFLPTSAGYQSALRISLDGHTVAAAVVLKHDDGSPVHIATDSRQWITSSTVTKSGLSLPRNINANAVNPALSVSTTSVAFSQATVVTQVASVLQLLTVTNTGTATLPLTFAIGGDFTLTNGCPALLVASASCNLQIGFAPSQPGQRNGVLSVATSNGFTPTYVSLLGTGVAILPDNNGTLDSGQTLSGEPIVAWYKVQQPLVSLTATTDSKLFGVALVADTGSGHGSLPAASFTQNVTANCNNCWLGIQFYPQIAGAADGSLILTSNAGGSPYALLLTGNALPVTGLVMSPVTQDFGSVSIHSSSGSATFMLANLLVDLTAVTVLSVSSSGDFIVTPNNSGGADCTATITATASCFVEVSFVPTATGARNGTLTIVTSSGSATAALSGTGTDDPGIGLNPVSLIFTNEANAAATQQTVVLTNTSMSTVSIGSPTVSNSSFSISSACSTLGAGDSCSLVVVFVPQSETVTATLTIPVMTAETSRGYTVGLAGTYTSQNIGLQIVADELNFGSTSTGAFESTRIITLNNLTSKTLSIAFTAPRQFSLATAMPCQTISAESSCKFSMAFLPVTGGPLTGTLFAQGTPTDDSPSVQALAYMLGYGVASGSLTISGNAIPNTPVTFGQVNSGQTAQQVLTVTNSGSVSMTIHRITSEPPFLTASTCAGSITPNNSCLITITYEPIDEVSDGSAIIPREDTGSITIESDALSSPDSVQFVGIVVPVVSSHPASSSVLSAFSLSQGSLTFPNTQIGDASAAQVVTLTNTGNTSIHISSIVVSPDYALNTTCAALLPGNVCKVTVQFTPTLASSSSVRSGTLHILSDAGTSLEFMTLLGTSTPAALTLTPSAVDFGTVDLGSSAALDVTVTDTAETPVTFLGLTTSGDYSVNAESCPGTGSTLAAGSSCVLTITFKPSSTGTRTGTLNLTEDASQLPLAVSLTGVAVQAQLKVTPGSLVFGSVDEGYPALMTLTLLNTGSASVMGITNAISGSNAGDFVVTAPCSTAVLAANQGCNETVTFTPSAVGARTATLTLASSDPNGPAMIALSGTGIQGGSFSLTANGGGVATVVVASGSPGIFALMLTPKNGFAGQVDLTCTPVEAGKYTSCSLLASTLILGSAPLSSTATINTITSADEISAVVFAGVLMFPFAVSRRGRNAGAKKIIYAATAILCFSFMTGCGGGGGATVNRVRTTPAGTYQYQVTASATSGAPASSSVMLTLVVQ